MHCVRRFGTTMPETSPDEPSENEENGDEAAAQVEPPRSRSCTRCRCLSRRGVLAVLGSRKELRYHARPFPAKDKRLREEMATGTRHVYMVYNTEGYNTHTPP